MNVQVHWKRFENVKVETVFWGHLIDLICPSHRDNRSKHCPRPSDCWSIYELFRHLDHALVTISRIQVYISRVYINHSDSNHLSRPAWLSQSPGTWYEGITSELNKVKWWKPTERVPVCIKIFTFCRHNRDSQEHSKAENSPCWWNSCDRPLLRDRGRRQPGQSGDSGHWWHWWHTWADHSDYNHHHSEWAGPVSSVPGIDHGEESEQDRPRGAAGSEAGIFSG